MILKQLLFLLIQSLKLGMQGLSKLAYHCILLHLVVIPLIYGTFICRVLSISEVRFKVSMAMSPSQRPRGVLGFWASLMTALGNTENMPVSVGILPPAIS